MKKYNLGILTLSSILLFSCTTTNEVNVRNIWNDDEKTKIESLLFEDSIKYVPCYVYEEVAINSFTSNEANFKKGVEISSKKAKENSKSEFEDILTSKKYVKENDKYKLTIDENEYLTCISELSDDVFKYSISYFNEEKPPVVEEKGWSNDEKAIIAKAFGDDYIDLLPSYDVDDRILSDETEDYNCLTLTSNKATIDDLAKYIESLTSLEFSYNEVGDFYFKFLDETNLKYVGIKPYIDVIDNNKFTIDYYVITLNDSTQISESWTQEDMDSIQVSFTVDALEFIPCYVTNEYEITPSYGEDMMTIISYGTFEYFNDYMQVFENFGYSKEIVEDGSVYYTMPFLEGSLDAFFVYDVEGYVEINIYYLTGKLPVEARKQWNDDEVKLINETFGQEISHYIPCFMYETSTIKAIEDHIVIEDLTVNENALIEAQAYFMEQEFEPDFDTNTYEKIIKNYGKVQLIPDFTDKFIIEIYFVKDTQKPTDTIKEDIKILPSEFGPQYVGSESSIELFGMNCVFNDIMYTASRMQFRRETSYIKNINELPKITSIKIERVLKGYEPADQEELSFYKSNDGINYEVVTRDENFVYDFSGATYFKIANESTEYAQSLKYIQIDFADF